MWAAGRKTASGGAPPAGTVEWEDWIDLGDDVFDALDSGAPDSDPDNIDATLTASKSTDTDMDGVSRTAVTIGFVADGVTSNGWDNAWRKSLGKITDYFPDYDPNTHVIDVVSDLLGDCPVRYSLVTLVFP